MNSDMEEFNKYVKSSKLWKNLIQNSSTDVKLNT